MAELSDNIIDDKYEIIDCIGEGSYGCIYKAIDKKNKKLVAIKIENDNNEILKKEIKTTLYLNKNNIEGVLKIQDYGFHHFNRYVVFNLLNNCFHKLMKINKQFSKEKIFQFAIASLNILKDIHSKNIVHRDIKPGNFMMSNDNNLYLIDFGLAECTTYVLDEKRGPCTIGTEQFCSINIQKGYEYSKRDDLISLGYVLSYFYLGKLPWQHIINEKLFIEKKKDKVGLYKLLKNAIQIQIYLEYCFKLKINETPDYKLLIRLFNKYLKNLSLKDNKEEGDEITNSSEQVL